MAHRTAQDCLLPLFSLWTKHPVAPEDQPRPLPVSFCFLLLTVQQIRRLQAKTTVVVKVKKFALGRTKLYLLFYLRVIQTRMVKMAAEMQTYLIVSSYLTLRVQASLRSCED